MSFPRLDIDKKRLRWLGFFIGAAFMFWLPIEDVTYTAVVILAAAVCFWFVLWYINKRNMTSTKFAWLGFIGGLMVGLISLLFMIFKIGLHNHNAPDFTLNQLLKLLFLSPVFGLCGFLAGWGIHFYLLWRGN
jgi:NADH:ubiquinone oxidoreductase subunit 6 (subunit J)